MSFTMDQFPSFESTYSAIQHRALYPHRQLGSSNTVRNSFTPEFPERQISPLRLTPSFNLELSCIIGTQRFRVANLSSSARSSPNPPPQNVRCWNIEGRHAATSPITRESHPSNSALWKMPFVSHI